MTLRAGSYDRATPEWRGIIRDEGAPAYECTHVHVTRVEASLCSIAALAAVKRGDALPPGWAVFARPGSGRVAPFRPSL